MKIKNSKRIENKYYWIIGGFIALFTYGILYLLYNLPCKDECFELIIFGFFIGFPCKILGIQKVCSLISVIIYFLIGSLIGLLISKIKK